MSPRSLPELIDESVSSHFREHSREIEDSLRTRIEDIQLGLLDKFFRTIQASYSERIAALEATAETNNRTMQQIQRSSRRAEDDLQRLAAGIRGLLRQPTTEQESAPAPFLKDRSPQV